MFGLGDCFSIRDSGRDKRHLHVICGYIDDDTGEDEDERKFLLIPIVTVRQPKKRTVYLYPGDHRFITTTSRPSIKDARIKSLTELSKGVTHRLIQHKPPPMTQDGLKSIMEHLEDPYVTPPRAVKEYAHYLY